MWFRMSFFVSLNCKSSHLNLHLFLFLSLSVYIYIYIYILVVYPRNAAGGKTYFDLKLRFKPSILFFCLVLSCPLILFTILCCFNLEVYPRNTAGCKTFTFTSNIYFQRYVTGVEIGSYKDKRNESYKDKNITFILRKSYSKKNHAQKHQTNDKNTTSDHGIRYPSFNQVYYFCICVLRVAFEINVFNGILRQHTSLYFIKQLVYTLKFSKPNIAINLIITFICTISLNYLVANRI